MKDKNYKDIGMDRLSIFGDRNYHLEMAFPIGNKIEDADIYNIPGRVYFQIPAGCNVDIHYLPAFPGKPSLDLDPATPWCLLGLPLALFFPIFLPWVLLNAQRNILINGQLTEGFVTRVVKGNKWLLEFNSKIHVSYSWKGKAYSGVGNYTGYGGENDPGDKVWVLVNPENPKDNMVYDDLECSWRPAVNLEYDNHKGADV